MASTLASPQTTKSEQQRCHPAFEFIREQHIDSLNIDIQEFTHIKTGAQHIHIVSDNKENVFLVALRTVPEDSTGVAHILEHTALCGSKKYPVRDPFFMMTRRSLNTFMNAFTSSDWTAYPFASLNKKDFNNLLDVYLDAVFFSRLDPLDFAQEGHRLEFSEANNPESTLEYKGVVFNEMKGAMSSVSSQLWGTLGKYLFPTNTYHHNSGGDPENIPDLSYEDLVSFYKTHYHPSNAIFMTYGDIPAAEHQIKFEEQALSQFEKSKHVIEVPDEQRYQAPVRVEESYPNNEDKLEKQTHVVMAWLLGNSTDLMQSLRAQLLSSVLLDNSATPLMHALESTSMGSAPSPLCGLDDSQKELTFMCGLSGSERKNADAIEELIIETITKVAENGIPQDELESALHQLELHQREVGGDSYPYGLQLILTALNNATHRGDPVKLLDIDAALEQLRKDIQSPDFIKVLAKDLLLNNQHRVRLTLVPDAELSKRKESAEKNKLEKIKSELSDEQKQNIISITDALKERQEQIDDETILPKVGLEDVPEKEIFVDGERSSINNVPICKYPTGTNGLIYQQVIFDLPKLSTEQLQLLPLYSSCVTELGVGENSYLDIQKRQASVTGSFSAYTSIRGTVEDAQKTNNFFVFSGKALNRNYQNLSDLMADTLTGVKFTEASRIKELISQIRTGREQRITGSGHSLAMTAASAGMNGASKLTHELSGLAAIRSIKILDDSFSDDSLLNAFAQKLAATHELIRSSQKQLLLVGETPQLNTVDIASKRLLDISANAFEPFQLDSVDNKIAEAWLTNSAVNFCAKAYPTVPMGHKDSAALVILGAFLRNGILHKTIREQGGAYGGGASQDNNNACFRFYSYRDPRIADTLNDFDKSIAWLLDEKHTPQKLEEAILGTMSSLDRSESPAGRAKRCFHSDLNGRTLNVRKDFRERVLSTSMDDLKTVAERYLTPEKSSTAIVTDKSNRDLAKDLGLVIQEL